MWRLSNKLLCWFLKLQDPILCGKLSKEWPKPSHLVAARHRLCFPLNTYKVVCCLCIVWFSMAVIIQLEKKNKNHSAQTLSRPWPSCLSPSYPFSWNETKLLTSHTILLSLRPGQLLQSHEFLPPGLSSMLSSSALFSVIK